MISNKFISVKRYKNRAKDEGGMFLVMVSIMLFTIFVFMALLVDIFILLQTQMDMKIAAQMMADGALRYMVDDDTWNPPGQGPPPSDTTLIKEKMLKLVESNYLIGNKKRSNLGSTNTITLNTGIYEVDKNTNQASFTNSVFPTTLIDRRNEPSQVPDKLRYWAVKVDIETNSNSEVAAIFSKFLNQTKTDIKTYAVAYYDSNSPAGASSYAFEN